MGPFSRKSRSEVIQILLAKWLSCRKGKGRERGDGRGVRGKEGEGGGKREIVVILLAVALEKG